MHDEEDFGTPIDQELEELRRQQALRDRQSQKSDSNKNPNGMGDICEIVMANYQRNVARREAREAKEKEVTAHRVATKTKPPAPPKSSGDNTHLSASRPSNAPCGIFLLALKKGDVTWRLQLFASELSNGEKVCYLRFQLWTPGEGGQPIKDGPGCGFSLSMREAGEVLSALRDGIRQVESGEFDPNAKGNYLPRRRGGRR